MGDQNQIHTRPTYKIDFDRIMEEFARYWGKTVGVKRPDYAGNMADVVEIGQREQGVTRATDPKPVLATFGIGPCVSLVGYSGERQTGFLTHYDGTIGLRHSFSELFFNLYRLGHVDGDRFDVRLVGEHEGTSDGIMSGLKTAIQHGSCFNMQLVEEDTGYIEGSRDIALDTRTGETFAYDPGKNPYRKQLSDLELKLMCLRISHPGEVEFVYRPE